MKGLSRLPVTEEIAGSNPVESAKKNAYHYGELFSCTALMEINAVCYHFFMSPERKTPRTSWTIKHDPITIDAVEFRKATGKRVERDEKLHAALTAMITHHFDGERQNVTIESYETQKPEWFLAAESDARAFIARLGFSELGYIHLLKDTLDRVEPGHDVDAFHDSITRDIFVSEARIKDILHTDGVIVAASVLVHELAHATAPKPDRITLQQRTDNSSYWLQRNGWLVSGDRGDRGSFLEEGFCEYVAGLYRRQCVDDRAPLLPAGYAPTQDLPSHLQTSAVLAGPDAHTIELIAWGVEAHGIMTTDQFIRKLFESRNVETAPRAMREVIMAIEALSPDLYSYLKNVERSKENWTAARNTVYAAVAH